MDDMKHFEVWVQSDGTRILVEAWARETFDWYWGYCRAHRFLP